MKKRETLLWRIFLIIFLVILYLPLTRDNFTKREKYEHFLSLQYKKILDANSNLTLDIKPDRPELAALQDYIMTLDPKTGVIPKYRLKDAFSKMVALKEKNNYAEDEIVLNWEELPADMGGRTRALAVDPSDPLGKRVLAGSVTGGLWINEDITSALSSWEPVNDFLDNLSISCIIFDPLDPNIVYAGTGEAQTAVTIYRESSGVGSGILKSTDGGLTWGWTNGNFAYITDILIRKEGGKSILYSAAVSGKYKEVNHVSRPSDGLYRSADGGNSWQQVLPLIPGGKDPYAPSDLEMSADGRIFVGTQRNLEGKGAAVILWSDDGVNWNINTEVAEEIDTLSDPTANIPGRVILASSLSDTNITYAAIASGGYSGEGFIRDRAYAIIKSDDKGESWEKVNMPNSDGSWAYLAWHAFIIKVDPNNPDVVYAGGLDLHKSLDGGNSWNKISDWRGPTLGAGGTSYVHADQHQIVFLNNSSDSAAFCTDGGIFFTSDGSAEFPGFGERNMNYNTIQYYSCAIHPEAGKNFYIAGTQDNGTMRYLEDPVSVNDLVSGGDGAFCFFDKNDPSYFITSVYYNRYYVHNISGNDVSDIVLYIDEYSGIFINPADYDYKRNVLYANAVTFDLQLKDNLLVVSDVTSSPNGSFIPLNTGSTLPFSHIRYSPTTSEVVSTVFAGTQSGRLFKIKNANIAPNVEEIGSASFPEANISCISIGSTENDILVSFSNFGVESVWESHDGGVTWRNIEGDLPDMPVRWILHHPQNSGKAIIATELGVWKTEDFSGSEVHWEPENQGLANVRVDMLKYRDSDQTYAAATHGRGLYVTRNSQTGIFENNSGNLSELKIYPNPNSGKFQVIVPYMSDYEVDISTLAGKLVYTKEFFQESRDMEFDIDISGNSSGIYILTVRSDNEVFSGKIIIQ